VTQEARASAAGAQWLARLRWGALAIVAASLVVAERALAAELPWTRLWTLVGLGIASNLWLTWRRSVPGHLGAYLVLDVLILTALLHYSGGPTNPFSIIYVVYIAMSAVMLAPRWTWAIAALSVASFAALFVVHGPNEHVAHGGHGDGFQAHLYGMLIALVLAVAMITYFVSQLSIELRRRERALAEAEERSHRWGKLASIANLAAGAAHELGTPLGTIAVAANEIRRRAESLDGAEGVLEDAQLIREELERCRIVLDRMAAAGGEPVGETVEILSLAELFSEVRARLGNDQARRWHTKSEVETIQAPREALIQMTENIARNGFDACEEGRVALVVRALHQEIEMRFTDEGKGMEPEVAARAADPFFTTKEAGDRMGLGLFLARTLVDSLGGRMQIESTLGRGTTIVVTLPQSR
jgi:two-component system sensor histidine kinase RegB